MRKIALGTDPLQPDTDGDGLPDGWELVHNMDPLVNNDATTTGACPALYNTGIIIVKTATHFMLYSLLMISEYGLFLAHH